jgi:integrase
MSIPPRPRTTIQKQKNANGQGSIWFSEKRDRWVAQFVGSSLTSSGLPKRHTKVFRFKKDAQDWISEQKRLKLHGKTSYSADSKINLADFLTNWLSARSHKLAPETKRNYEGAIKRIAKEIGNLNASKLSPHAIEELVKTLEIKYSDSVAHNAYSVMRIAYKYAFRMGDFPINPFDKVDPPRVHSNPLMHIPMTDFKKIYSAAQLNPYTHARIELGAMVGPRPAEILGLLWSDLDWENHTITIARQLQRVAGEGLVFREVKQKKIRKVPISETTLNILKTHFEYQQMSKTTWEDDLNLIFPNTIGKPLDAKRDRKWWLDLLERAEVPHYTLYQLRKTAYSLIASTGVGIPTLLAFTGHSSSSTVLKHYAFSTDESMAEALRKMDLFRPLPDEGSN